MAAFLQKAKDAMQIKPNAVTADPTGTHHTSTNTDQAVAKLQAELEIMADYKLQNVALKEQLHAILAENKLLQQKQSAITVPEPVAETAPAVVTHSHSSDNNTTVAADGLAAALKKAQDQNRTLQESKSILEQQFKQSLQVKEKDWRAQLDKKDADLKAALEQHDRDAKKVLEQREKDFVAQLEKKSKADKEALKSVQRQLDDREKEWRQTEQAHADAVLALTQKMETLSMENSTLHESLAELREASRAAGQSHDSSAMVNRALTEQLQSAASRCDVLTAELEVARAGQERASNSLQEREEAIKKLKQKLDDAGKQQHALKVQAEEKAAALEQSQLQCADFTQQLTTLRQELELSQAVAHQLTADKESLSQDSVKTAAELEAQRARIDELETELKAVERRHALIVKDYQKQVSRASTKDVSISGEHLAGEDSNKKAHAAVPPSPVTATSTAHNADPQLMLRLQTLQNDKFRMEAELKAANEKLAKTVKDNESKAKVIMQYALRDTMSKPSTTAHSTSVSSPAGDTPSGSRGNLRQDNKALSLMTSAALVKNLDKEVLAEINIKLQTIVADMSTRTLELEQELDGLKDLIRRQALDVKAK